MSNAITVADVNNALPAHLAELFGFTANDELAGGVSVGYPIISYKGKVWHVNEGGNTTLVARHDEPDTPAAYLDVVIVKANPNLSKIYYAGAYEEGSNAKPTCYSHDGRTPALDATTRQADSCAVCPNNAWGSRTTDNGAKGKACADSRRIAIAPVEELNRPMLLRIPAGSLKELVSYADKLTGRKVPYGAVVTRIGFDHTVAHPKFTFKAIRFIDKNEAEALKTTLALDVVNQIVGMQDSPAAAAPKAAPVAVPAPAPKPAPVAAAPVAKPAPAPAAKPKPKITESEVDALFGDDAPATKAAQPAPAAAKPSKIASLISEADAGLDAVLGHLDD